MPKNKLTVSGGWLPWLDLAVVVRGEQRGQASIIKFEVIVNALK